VWRGAALGALLIAAAGSVARAHNVAADLSVWGNFGTDTARCQRTIARAASYCTARVLAVRNDCLGAQLRGEPCDQAATDAAIQGARSRATDLVARVCTPPELQTLRYVDLQDAQNDVTKLCRGLDTAATTASYGPVMFGGTVAETTGSTQVCLDV